MSTKTNNLKHPEHGLADKKTGLPIHEAKTEGLEILTDELASINKYLDAGHARGRAHSKAAVINGQPGYFFVTSLEVAEGERRDCIMFSTLVNGDILLTDFS